MTPSRSASPSRSYLAPENQVALCAFHHLRCIHGGFLAAFGRAPDALTWMVDGKVFTGP